MPVFDRGKVNSQLGSKLADLARIRPGCPADLGGVAEVHIACFPRSFLTLFGAYFVAEYYRVVLEFEQAITLVAETDDGVAGFISGYPNLEDFRNHLWRKKGRFVMPACRVLLRHPTRIISVFRKLLDIATRRGESPFLHDNSCEVSPLAVHPASAGRGIGKQLVIEFINVASTRGAVSVHLNTDAADNESVNSFYRNLGFTLCGTFVNSGDRVMNSYVIRTR